MKIVLLVIFCLLKAPSSWAQDERFFRKLFSGDLARPTDIVDQKKYSYLIHTPEYAIDLDDDKKSESLVFVKRDSEDWIDVFNSYHELIFQYRFEEKGVNSGVYRVVKKQIDQNTNALVLFYFEGETKYVDHETSARVYVLTIDKKNLKKLSVFKGPSIFEEYKSLKNHYHLRNYQVEVSDLNLDKRRELIVKYHGVSQVFFYQGEGKWLTFKR